MWWVVPWLLSVLLLGCDSNSQLHIVNGTDEVTTLVTIGVPGSRLEIQGLAVGHTRTWEYRPERDGCFEVRARFASGAALVSCVGYTTPNEGISHRLTLGRNGTIEYQVLD
jgi:hypothetical protein